MKCLVCFLLLVSVHAAVANDPDVSALPVVSVGPFPVPHLRVSAAAKPGHPSDLPEQPSPFSTDLPPSLKIEVGTYPTREADNACLTVYRISEVYKASYKTIRPKIEQLQKLLQKRRKGNLDRLDVPVYPIPNAILLIQAKTQFFDADWGSGIFYIATFTNGVAEYPDNFSLYYSFAGLSADGKFYVSAEFHITHPKLAVPEYLPQNSGRTDPASRKADQAAADAATARAQKFLPKEPDSSFTPPLDKLRQWVSTLVIQ